MAKAQVRLAAPLGSLSLDQLADLREELQEITERVEGTLQAKVSQLLGKRGARAYAPTQTATPRAPKRKPMSDAQKEELSQKRKAWWAKKREEEKATAGHRYPSPGDASPAVPN